MKTAVSLPDEIFESAEAEAHRQGLSRSELYARAIEEYLLRRAEKETTERLNAVYAAESGRVEPGLARAQLRSLKREKR
ncbi:MAG: hypothetical protein MUC42_06830 [Bryobacter sp.]|jgi:metal-responsive CopG/Arc/MetJ family transcriptional regulator|nr:hypothetical protein [Bryobacter sp.]